jgi:hypothetical protein
MAEKKIVSEPASASDYETRVDPDGTHRRLTEGMALLTTGPGGWLMKKLGVDAEMIESARAAPKQFADLVGGLETVAETLAPLGWMSNCQMLWMAA